MPGLDFPEYAIRYSKNARELRDQLTYELRSALLEIEGELVENPDKYPSRLIQLDQHIFIYKHEQPAIQITYRINREQKLLDVLHLVSPKLEVSKTLFISYSHKDKDWLIELKKWLKPLEKRDMVTIWDDEKIKAGADWRHEIERELAAAKAAVLLISMNYLSSEFIANNELPQLLDAAKERGLHVLWIAVRESNVDDTDIAKYQAVHKEPPLAQIEESARDAYFKSIYKQIKEAIGP